MFVWCNACFMGRWWNDVMTLWATTGCLCGGGGCCYLWSSSKTRRNLTIKYLNLNFVVTSKWTPVHWFYTKRFLFLLVHSCFANAYTSKPFQYWYFVAYSFGFKVFNQIGACRNFQLAEKKKCFVGENAKEVVKDLGTGSFVTVTNLAPHSCGCGEILPGQFFLITFHV